MRPSLKQYIEQEILPRYDHFDSAHRRDHAEQVMRESVRLAALHGAREELAYTIAAYHDTGLVAGRELHHIHSGKIIRADQRLREWFTEEEIALMAEAAEDHRASSDHAPRTIYGQIVAEADRTIEPLTILRRTVQYGLTHYPTLTREEHYNRFLGHLLEKYAEGGYLRLWIADPEKEQRLGELRALIRDRKQLRAIFEQLFKQETER
ncbi:MAG: HD domain-containing protein [Rikenellaceae bacterium]|nr:HD domain-containing protein [Rikenellaceae bacterium]